MLPGVPHPREAQIGPGVPHRSSEQQVATTKKDPPRERAKQMGISHRKVCYIFVDFKCFPHHLWDGSPIDFPNGSWIDLIII